MASGWVLSRWEYSVAAFQAVIFGSAFLRVFSLRWQWMSPTRPHRRAPGRPASRSAARSTSSARSGSFLAFVVFGAVWSFAANCFGPFYTVFMFDRVGFSALDVGRRDRALARSAAPCRCPPGAASSTATATSRSWCSRSSSGSSRCSSGASSNPGNRAMLYVLWTWIGATSAGFVLGQFTILLRLIPPAAKKLAIGFNLAVVVARRGGGPDPRRLGPLERPGGVGRPAAGLPHLLHGPADSGARRGVPAPAGARARREPLLPGRGRHAEYSNLGRACWVSASW